VSFVSVEPEGVSSAAGNLESIGSTLNVANSAAAAPTAGLQPAAADQVSAAVTAAFAQHAQDYQFIGAQVSAFHDQFVGTLNAGVAQYATTEVDNAAQQAVASTVNGPAQALLRQPIAAPSAGASASAAPAESGSPQPITVLNTGFGPAAVPLALASTPAGPPSYSSAASNAAAPVARVVSQAAAPYNVALASGNSMRAFAGVVQTGNPMLTAGAWFGAPLNVLSAIRVGAPTLGISPSGSGASGSGPSQTTISTPLKGFLSPLEPVTLTLGASPTILSVEPGPLVGGVVTEVKQLGAR